MARERTSLFPDDASGWWMLATVYSRADEEEALQQTVRIADALSQGEELSFPELLSAARLAMQAGSLAEAARWVAKLDVARPETEWEVMWRACRKSALLQLRGRFGEAQQVLAAALGQLASPPGDPYTIVATALFYSHLYFGSLETASQVAAEYAGAFDDRSKPDHWAAQMLGVALAAHREEWPDERIRSEGERVGEALSASAGGLGRKEREASLCLLLSHAASAAEGRRLALAADPENTMVAGCRFLSGQALAEKGLHEEAAGQFARARKEMLYRGDWYLELYLPTLLGEAQAREKAGEAEAARGLYEEIVEAYANADRELAEVAEAKDSLKRLAGH
jgi:tetratricopeptide (TPR) repeat protein